MTTLEVGSIFAGDFRIVRPLAAGGMGSLFVVEQLSTHKLRALKIMQQHLLSDGALLKRFVQEAKLGARIESEHVVEVHAAGVDTTTGYPYLVMELLEGEDLAHRVENHGPLGIAEILVIVSQLAHALGAAHAAGVIHRDLKPENVFLAASKRADVTVTVKILDFGIAKLVAEGTSQTGAMGSPLWLAPEQTEPGPITPAADIWALGLLVFHMLTARYFWRSTDGTPTVAQLLREVVLEPIPAASERAKTLGITLPPGFDAWFERAVCRDPQRRFPTAGAAHAELARCFAAGDAYAATIPSLAPQADVPTRPSVPNAQPKPARETNVTPPPLARTADPTPARGRRWLIAIALPVVLLSLGVGWALGHKQTTTTATTTSPSTTPSTSTSTTTSTSPSPSTSTSTTTSTSPSTSTSTSTSTSPSTSPVPSTSTSAPAPDPAPRRPALAPEGTLPEGSVERVLRSHASANTACFKSALRRDPTLHGLIRIRFYIALDGSVRKVVDTGSTINDDEMRACVFRLVQSMHFPKPVGGEVPVDVPFRYEPVAPKPSASDAPQPP